MKQKRQVPIRHVWLLSAVGLMLSLLLLAVSFTMAGTAHAQVGPVEGAIIVPQHPDDFGSSSVKESLDNLRATGANNVNLLVPYQQDHTHSTDIYDRWNTPTDEALIEAINYANSIGFQVAITVHIETAGGDWRAHINPDNREAWFNSYTNVLTHLAEIAENHDVWLMVLGSELVNMATENSHPDNTQHWINMINQVRGIYSGSLTYSANSNTNDHSAHFSNEKVHIGFWGHLDYLGLSAYYPIWGDGSNSVESFKGTWDHWNTTGLSSFQAEHGKPLIFTEIGYRSVEGAHMAPWSWWLQGAYDGQLQANLYEALFDYWGDHGFMHGVFLWNWKSDPNGGWPGDIGYTPQNKPAQEVMEEYFDSSDPGQPGEIHGEFSTTATADPASPSVGESTTVFTEFQNHGEGVSDVIADIEIYDNANQQVFQELFEGQNFGAGESKVYESNWTPQSDGQYTVMTGIFSSNWSSNPFWDSNTLEIEVGEVHQEFSAFAWTDNPSPNVGESVGIFSEIQNHGSAVSDVIVDVEIWNDNNEQVFQEFFEGQMFGSGEEIVYESNWTPQSQGQFFVRIGVFSSGWANLILWEHNALEIGVVGSEESSEPNNPSFEATEENEQERVEERMDSDENLDEMTEENREEEQSSHDEEVGFESEEETASSNDEDLEENIEENISESSEEETSTSEEREEMNTTEEDASSSEGGSETSDDLREEDENLEEEMAEGAENDEDEVESEEEEEEVDETEESEDVVEEEEVEMEIQEA